MTNLTYGWILVDLGKITQLCDWWEEASFSRWYEYELLSESESESEVERSISLVPSLPVPARPSPPTSPVPPSPAPSPTTKNATAPKTALILSAAAREAPLGGRDFFRLVQDNEASAPNALHPGTSRIFEDPNPVPGEQAFSRQAGPDLSVSKFRKRLQREPVLLSRRYRGFKVRELLVQYVRDRGGAESLIYCTTASKCCRSMEVESQVVANGRFLGVGQRACICSSHYESLGNITYKDGVAFTFSKEIPDFQLQNRVRGEKAARSVATAASADFRF
ncbi:hypothetical protein B0H13DRAFT_1901484 [Mycena leptocephala]|nr:hypothetical protein B0H13DRAFT_1901484 [Mycena leptocephala]